MPRCFSRSPLILSTALALTAFCLPARAAVTLLGVQYQQDDVMPEYKCYWHDDCHNDFPGANLHVYIKNTGTSAITVNDVTLAGYSLETILVVNTNYHSSRSIYYYWDTPPQDIMNAGAPMWYKADPKTIPAGGVGQAVVRLRFVPTTPTVSIGVVTSGGNISTSIAVDISAPQLASVGFSADRKKVYLSWRRLGGAAPLTIKMDGVDVTSQATTVGDPTVDFAVSVLNFATPIPDMSYHVYQGVYADGRTATASLRTWINPFVHGCWGARSGVDGDLAAARAYVDDATNRGINAMIYNGSNIMNDLNGTAAGRQYSADRGFGFGIDYVGKWGIEKPLFWFINDEPDAQEANVSNTFCGSGLRLQCGTCPMGVLTQRYIGEGEALRAANPLSPTMVNLDGAWRPLNYYAWGQSVDFITVDPYYQRRLQDVYWRDQDQIYLYEKATYIYAVSKAMVRAAEPNPAGIVLYSCSWKCDAVGKCDPEYVGSIWPFPDPDCKRIEAYYALAAGAKGLAYWWWNSGWPSRGLNDGGPGAMALWKSIGLYGTEIKTLAPQLVASHPVNMTLTPSTNVWARALASGTDTIILLAVNDDYYNDTAGFHRTLVPNASVVATLPNWMTSPTPTAFEVRTGGLYDVTTSLAGNNLTVQLGTLDITRMIVITTNPALRSMVQSRYVSQVWPGVCAFAPEHCFAQTSPPSIVQHPTSQTISANNSADFVVVANGSTPLSYQWQKNTQDLSDGGHYAGTTTPMLTVSSADANDAGSYRCVVTNAYGNATSDPAILTVNPSTGPTITQHPSAQGIFPGGAAAFTVTAVGNGSLTFQWQKNQADLSNGGHYAGVTTPTLIVSAADANDAAAYRCVVTDTLGSIASNEASLSVSGCATPVLVNGGFEGGQSGGIAAGWTAYSRAEIPAYIGYTIQTAAPAQGAQYQQIQSAYVASGGAGIYQVVTGCIPGATYRVQGSYRTNSTTGRAAVKCAPNGSTSYDAAVDLSPAVSTTSTTWVAFNSTITATASSITLFLDCQTFVSVTGNGKAAAFDNITVSLVGCTQPAAPGLSLQPAPLSLCAGANGSLTVSATGQGPLIYQWQKDLVYLENGGHRSGVNSPTLSLTGLDIDDTGSYRCIVSNAGGSTVSNAVAVTIHSQMIADFDSDCDVDQLDFDAFAACVTAPDTAVEPGCESRDFDHDNDVDQSDFGTFQRCYTTSAAPPPGCTN